MTADRERPTGDTPTGDTPAGEADLRGQLAQWHDVPPGWIDRWGARHPVATAILLGTVYASIWLPAVILAWVRELWWAVVLLAVVAAPVVAVLTGRAVYRRVLVTRRALAIWDAADGPS